MDISPFSSILPRGLNFLPPAHSPVVRRYFSPQSPGFHKAQTPYLPRLSLFRPLNSEISPCFRVPPVEPIFAPRLLLKQSFFGPLGSLPWPDFFCCDTCVATLFKSFFPFLFVYPPCPVHFRSQLLKGDFIGRFLSRFSKKGNSDRFFFPGRKCLSLPFRSFWLLQFPFFQ